MTLLDHFKTGGCFPVGGSSELTRAVAEPIAARGGKVRTRANVKEIIIENGTAKGVRYSQISNEYAFTSTLSGLKIENYAT